MSLPRNKTGHKFFDNLNEILSATLNDSNAETAMYCAMVMPHLIIAITRTEDDVGPFQWIKWDLDSLFLEATAIQERINRTKAKQSVDEYNEFDEYMST